MPKTELIENRFDFRGGINTITSEDAININELSLCENARHTGRFGAVTKRTGSRRLHPTAIGGGAAVRGLVQWRNQAGNLELIAVSNTNLYHKTTELGDFTEVISAAFSSTAPTYTNTFRSTSAAALVELWLASSGNVLRWDGSTLSQRDGTNSVPEAFLLAPYHTRMFWVAFDELKRIQWGVVGDANDASIDGTPTGGGAAIVDILTGDDIVAIERVGASLAIATEDSIVRFTGYSDEDIQISQDTEGISSDVGPVGQRAFIKVASSIFMLSDTGPFIVNDGPGGVKPIGPQVEPLFDQMDRSNISNAIIGYHKGRREVWYAFEDSTDTGNQSVLVFSLRLQTWCGPFTYPFAITTMAQYEDPNGDQFIIAGCSDGFIRHLDTGALDDILSDGTSGSVYTMDIRFPIFFENGPGVQKSLNRAFVYGDLPAGSNVILGWLVDSAAAIDTQAITEISGPVAQSYRVDLSGQGNRIILQITDATSTIPEINGIQIYAWDMVRRNA